MGRDSYRGSRKRVSVLVNEDGQLVGVITSSAAISSFIKYTGTIPQSINWAVKAYYVLPLYKQNEEQQNFKFNTKKEIINQIKSSVCQIRVK